MSNKRLRTTLNIDLNLLVVLHALLEERSVTKAASRVCLSQPATSSALSRLRDIFEDPLLVRLGNKMELTRLALELREPLAEAMQAIDMVLGEPLPFDPAKAHTTIRVGASDYIGIILLPALAKQLQTLAPGFELQVSPLREPEIVQRLEKDDVDLLLGHFPHVPHLQSEILFSEKFVCVMRDEHPLLQTSKEGRISLKDFVSYGHVAVGREGGEADLVDTMLGELHLERRVSIHVPHFMVAPGIVAVNDLIAVVTERIVRKLQMSFRLAALDLPAEFGLNELPIHMVWSRDTEDNPALSWLRSLILRLAKTI